MAMRICSIEGQGSSIPSCWAGGLECNHSERASESKCLAWNTIDLPAWLKSMSSCTRLMSFTGATRLVRAFLLCQSRPGTKPNAALRTCGRKEVAATF